MQLLKSQLWLFIKTRIKAKLLTLTFKALLIFFSDFSFSFLSFFLSHYIPDTLVFLLFPKLVKFISHWRYLHCLFPPSFCLEGSFLRSSLSSSIPIIQVSDQIYLFRGNTLVHINYLYFLSYSPLLYLDLFSS